MKYIGTSTLFFLIFTAGPAVAMLGHAVDCGLFDIESTIRTCADGSRVSKYWTYASIMTSTLPAVILLVRLSRLSLTTPSPLYEDD